MAISMYTAKRRGVRLVGSAVCSSTMQIGRHCAEFSLIGERRVVAVGVCSADYDPNTGPPVTDPDFNDGQRAAWEATAMWSTSPATTSVRLLLDCDAGTIAQLSVDGESVGPTLAHGLEGLELRWYVSISMGCGVRVRRVDDYRPPPFFECQWV